MNHSIKFAAGPEAVETLKRSLTARGVEIVALRSRKGRHALECSGDKKSVESAFKDARIANHTKLNESVIDVGKFVAGNGEDPASLIKLHKGAKKRSLLDDAKSLDEPEETPAESVEALTDLNDPIHATDDRDEPADAPTIEQLRQQRFQANISTTNRVAQLRAMQQLRAKKIAGSARIPQTVDERAQQNTQLVKDYNEASGQRLPAETDLIGTVEQIEDALEEIPGSEDMTLSDFDIVPAPMRKDKTGYTKTLVTIKKGSVPQEISALATEVKKMSKGIVKHRIMDMRTIANTNKTQLRGSEVKLTLTSINFKPDGENKARKGTRFIVSLPDDFSATKDVIVYIQESRDKAAMTLRGSSFSGWDSEQTFLAEAIANYYQYGYASTKALLAGKDVSNPLMAVAKSVLKSGGFTVRPKTDAEGHVPEIVVDSKGVKNQWLEVRVFEASLSGTYKVKCVSKVDGTWSFDINSAKGVPLTIFDLSGDKFVGILHSLWERDWKLEDGDDREYYLIAKLTYRNLKDVFIKMWEETEGENRAGLKIGATLSQKDTARDIPGSYAAEGIVGKTEHIDYFILTYLAVHEHGGDKRNPEEYITSDEYHEKYSVASRGDYSERKHTLLAKEGEARNYHSRIYKFQLEYAIGGVKSAVTDASFDAIAERTGFLTDSPKSI